MFLHLLGSVVIYISLKYVYLYNSKTHKYIYAYVAATLIVLVINSIFHPVRIFCNCWYTNNILFTLCRYIYNIHTYQI